MSYIFEALKIVGIGALLVCGLRLVNSVGIIDSDYRGEVKVKLRNDSPEMQTIFAGDRIAQAKVVPVYQVQFVAIDELSATARGVGGFGSTGQ